MAASIAVVAIGAWLIQNAHVGRALAADVVAHVAGEPQAWQANDRATDVARTLALHHVRLPAALGRVVYARTCLFRGREIPHLVLATASGLVTILILPDEHAARPVEIAHGALRGRMLPSHGGTLAIIGRSRLARDVEDRIAAAVDWEA